MARKGNRGTRYINPLLFHTLPDDWRQNELGMLISYDGIVCDEEGYEIIGRPDKQGRLVYTRICYKGIRKRKHVWVADAWIPNPYELPEVRHINDNPADDRVCNLARGTQRDNQIDATRNGRMNPNNSRTMVRARSMITGEWTGWFMTISDAGATLGIQFGRDISKDISKVHTGKYPSTHKYTFEFKEV